MCDIAGCAFGGDAMQCSLDDGIRLGVNGTDAMPVHDEMTDFIAMLLPGRRAIKARRENAFFQHQHTADKGPVTGASFGNRIGDF